MSLSQKEMLKKVCQVECPPEDEWEAEGAIPQTAAAARLLDGTAGMRCFHTF